MRWFLNPIATFFSQNLGTFCKILVNFESVQKFLFRRIFRFFLHGTVEQAEILIIFFFLNFLDFFWGRNFETKVNFSDFGSNFSVDIFAIFRKFFGLGARLGRILPFGEERIQICVDTAEKWVFENCEIFASFPIRKRGQLVSIITFCNRHRLGPDLNQISISVRRWGILIFSSIGVDGGEFGCDQH